MNAHPFVSVIVPLYAFQKCLADCVEALGRQNYPQDRFEILVVYNAPEKTGDPAPERVRQLLARVPSGISARMVREYKHGSFSARNQGVREAKGEVLAFTDSDCRPLPNWLKEGVQKLEQSGPVSVVIGRVKIFARNRLNLNLFERYELLYALRQREYVRYGNFGATANILVRKSTFLKVGFFDEELPSGGDKEWGWRAVKTGCNLVYTPEAVIFHPAIFQFRDLLRKHRRMTGGHFDLEKRWPGTRRPFRRGYRYPGVRSILKSRTPLQMAVFCSLHYFIRTVIAGERLRCRWAEVRIRG